MYDCIKILDRVLDGVNILEDFYTIHQLDVWFCWYNTATLDYYIIKASWKALLYYLNCNSGKKICMSKNILCEV